MTKEKRLSKVWARKDETLTLYRSLENGLKTETGYDLKKIEKLVSEYDLTVEDFQEYGRTQNAKEVSE